jgi:Ca2+-binding RTX toxin-like protein
MAIIKPAAANGNDHLTGTPAADTLDGGPGADTLEGGLGNDTYFVDDPDDRVIEPANGGIDTVRSSISYALGANLENLWLTGTDAISGIGNALDNLLFGNAGNNLLDGGAGTDTVSYAHAAGGVTVSLATSDPQDTGGDGIDTLLNIEGLIGSPYADKLTGNGLNNTLDGGPGADTLIGGTGNDRYFVDNPNDKVVENANEGNDMVLSTISYVLGPHVENLRLLGTAGIFGIGNNGNNSLIGNDGDNLLDGGGGIDGVSYAYAASAVTVSLAVTGPQNTLGAGTDTLRNIENLTGSRFDDNLAGNGANNVLDGGAGADTLIGGAGNDRYLVDDPGDRIIENANEGRDAVFSSVDFTLGDNLEELRLTGGALRGAGNAANNVLYGNAADNVLDGGAGTDTVSYLYAGAGVAVSLALTTAQNTLADGFDTLLNIENLTGSNYDDTLAGNGKNNVLRGGNGNDTLDGGPGADVLYGGAGEDTFVLGSLGAADRIADFVAGTDRIAIPMALLPVGNGDARIEGASVVAGFTPYGSDAELVVFTNHLYGPITTTSASALINAASFPYRTNDHRIFVVDNGRETAVYYFTAANGDPNVDAGELSLLGVLSGIGVTAGDFLFQG